MKTILALVGPGLGHYHPIGGLLRRLSGCRVVVVAQVGRDSALAARIGADGFEFVPLDDGAHRSLGKRVVHRVVQRTLARTTDALARLLPGVALPSLLARAVFGIKSYLRECPTTTRERLRFLDEVIQHTRPDIIFADSVLAAPMAHVCAKHEIPWIEHATGPVPVSTRGRPIYPSGLSPSMRAPEVVVNALLMALCGLRATVERRQLRRAIGAGAQRMEERQPIHRIAFSVADLDDYQSAPQSRFEYVGCSLYGYSAMPRDDMPQGKRELIYVTFGSSDTRRDGTLLLAIARALVSSERRERVVIQTTRADIAAALRQLIAERGASTISVLGARPHPAYDIYARARLVISHGGYNTVTESLYFGAPLLLVPKSVADRMEVARRVLEHGCGRCINYYRFSERMLLREVEFLLHDPAIQRNAARIGRLLRDDRQQAALVSEVSELLGPRGMAGRSEGSAAAMAPIGSGVLPLAHRGGAQ